jgi:hypothetical protein
MIPAPTRTTCPVVANMMTSVDVLTRAGSMFILVFSNQTVGVA